MRPNAPAAARRPRVVVRGPRPGATAVRRVDVRGAGRLGRARGRRAGHARLARPGPRRRAPGGARRDRRRRGRPGAAGRRPRPRAARRPAPPRAPGRRAARPRRRRRRGALPPGSRRVVQPRTAAASRTSSSTSRRWSSRSRPRACAASRRASCCWSTASARRCYATDATAVRRMAASPRCSARGGRVRRPYDAARDRLALAVRRPARVRGLRLARRGLRAPRASRSSATTTTATGSSSPRAAAAPTPCRRCRSATLRRVVPDLAAFSDLGTAAPASATAPTARGWRGSSCRRTSQGPMRAVLCSVPCRASVMGPRCARRLCGTVHVRPTAS